MGKIKINPKITIVKLSRIKPSTHNPRKISDEALMGLRNSLEQFGYVDLIVVNKRNMTIIAGHQRYQILKSDRVKEAPVILLDLDDIEEQILNITLNNTQITGEFNEALIPILEKIKNEFGERYLNLRLDKLRKECSYLETENNGAGKTLPDDIPKTPKKAITKRGDLWILGKHRLLCGDSTQEEDVRKLMGNNKARLFATDPPYLVDYTGANRPTGGKDWSDVYHEIDIQDAKSFLRNFLSVGLKFIEQNSAIYVWHAFKRVGLLNEICMELELLVHQQIIWVKPCAILTYSYYAWRHEPCLLIWQKGYKPDYNPSIKSVGSVWTIDLLRSGDPSKPEYYTDVWELDWEGKKRNTGNQHPTVKPTEVFAIPMRLHTTWDDICYEPFSGSGSQIIAAERLHRRCFAIEIEPVFCDVAVKRWEDFTGHKAKLSKK